MECVSYDTAFQKQVANKFPRWKQGLLPGKDGVITVGEAKSTKSKGKARQVCDDEGEVAGSKRKRKVVAEQVESD